MMGEDDDYDPIRDHGVKRRLIERKSDRKRRKLKSIRKKHNQSAHHARDNNEEKRAKAIQEVRLAREEDTERMSAQLSS